MKPGQSRKVQVSPRYSVVAMLISVDICRARASAVPSPTVLPSRTLPLRLITPVSDSTLSSREVLPDRYGPTKAAQRGAERGLVTGILPEKRSLRPSAYRFVGPAPPKTTAGTVRI